MNNLLFPISLLLSIAVIGMSIAVSVNLVRKTRGKEQTLIKYGAIIAIGISGLDIVMYSFEIYRPSPVLDILSGAGYLMLLYGILLFLRKVGPQKKTHEKVSNKSPQTRATSGPV